MERYDLIVAGGDTAGHTAAAEAARLGARVALVEPARPVGEQLWTGSVPSAALLACGKAAAVVRTAVRFGVHAEPRIDFAESMRWVRAARERIAAYDGAERARITGVDVLTGTARFTGRSVLDVDGRAHTAKRIVIATGSRPTTPDIPGLDTVPFLTSETIFELTQRPGHLVILGGGPVGLELAQAFVRLGTRVTVIERGERLLPREEVELAGLLGDRLVAEGVKLELGATVTAARRSDFGVVLTRTLDGVSGDVGGTHLLVATGRQSRTDSMDLERGGVELRDGSVQVDAHLRTTSPGVWACGDCIGGMRGTHAADYEARLVIRNAFVPLPRRADYSGIPWVTYTDPELAHVGLTEREGRERHGPGVRAFTRPFTEIDRAITDGQTAGGVKLVTSASGRLIGGHILGSGAGEMIGEVALAVSHGLSIDAIGILVHAYPTMSDAIGQAARKHHTTPFGGPANAIARWLVRRR